MSENQAQKESNFKNANRIAKIHRRKNKQIAKQYKCTENCGKAYGSYAALYTHIRNKHGNTKPPQMKNNRPKIGKKGRPQTKQTQKIQQMSGECRVCAKLQCQCVEKYDSEQKNQIIETMADDDFINFTNQIGNLSKAQGLVLVRSTQEDYFYLSQQRVVQCLKQFNLKYGQQFSLSRRLTFFLSLSSRYWQPQIITQLYNTIFVIKNLLNISQAEHFIQANAKEFTKIIKCIENDHSEFEVFSAVVKKI